VRTLDPDREIVKREVLFGEPDIVARDMDRLMRYLLKDNTVWGWLRSVLAPTKLD
jgi:hypothetical protein